MPAKRTTTDASAATARKANKAAPKKSSSLRAAQEDAKAARTELKAEAKAARGLAKEATKRRLQEAVTDATKRVASNVVDRIDGPARDVDVVPEPPWWKGRKAKTKRAPISRDAIIDAAIRILDAEGVDALTVRRLATELETGPATLYWHIAGKDELGELVYDRMMGEIELPEPDPSRWDEQVKLVATQIHRVLVRHNDAARLSLGTIPTGPNMLRLMEWQLGLFRAVGMPDEITAYFGDLLGRYIDASALEEHGVGVGDDGETDEKAGMLRDYFENLPPGAYPNLHAMVGTMFTIDNERRFELGLDIILRGLAGYLP